MVKGANYKNKPFWSGLPNIVYDIEPVKVTKIDISPQNYEIHLDEEISPSISIYPIGALNKEVKLKSLDESKLVYLGNGKFYSIAQGITYIVVETTDGSNLQAKCKVTIS